MTAFIVVCCWLIHSFLAVLYVYFCRAAISLAILRDGSSGGVVRLASITADGIERQTILHDELPQWDALSWWTVCGMWQSFKQNVICTVLRPQQTYTHVFRSWCWKRLRSLINNTVWNVFTAVHPCYRVYQNSLSFTIHECHSSKSQQSNLLYPHWDYVN